MMRGKKMIKEFMKKTLAFTAIMVLSVFAVSFFWAGATPEILLVFELFLLAFAITLTQKILERFAGTNFIVNIVIEYFIVSVLVLLYGCFAQWFFRSNWWMAFLYVAIVYIPAYFLDMAIVKRDVDYINAQLERRRIDEGEISE